MQELEQMINIYHIAFIVFLILTIVFLIVSVILFFRFNIRGIYDMRTGRGARRTIQRMEEINAQTGKLRQDLITTTPVRLSPKDRISAPVTEERKETELLADQGTEKTTLLQDYNQTTVLSPDQKEDIPQPEHVKLPGAFKIEKEIMWIHTEEML